eukprot:1004109-Pleurochrysis_carterae.AAC.1
MSERVCAWPPRAHSRTYVQAYPPAGWVRLYVVASIPASSTCTHGWDRGVPVIPASSTSSHLKVFHGCTQLLTRWSAGRCVSIRGDWRGRGKEN